DLYEGGIRVPLIAWWPGRIAAGQVTDQVMASWDILPTLADLIGVSLEQELDGISMLPTLTATGSQTEHDYLYWEYFTYNWGWNDDDNTLPRNWLTSRAVRMGPWKVIHQHIEDPALESWEVYHLGKDPEEMSNVAGDVPDVLERARSFMEEASKESSPYFPYDSYTIPSSYDTPFDFKNGQELRQFLNPVKDRLLITSHRGDQMAGFGENSIAGFARTLEN